jgi:thioredoxin-dependent peroxiredoxin
MKRMIFGLAMLMLGLASLPAAEDKAPPKVGDEAKDFELADLAGKKVKFSTITGNGPVVLVVLRGYPGYQCPLCTVQVNGLVKQAEAFEKAGAKVVFVYPGPSDVLTKKAEEFLGPKASDFPKNFTFLLDPDYNFTNLYNLRWDAKSETAYPTTYVVDAKRKITFAKVSKSHGGRTTPEEVLKAVAAK